MQWSTCTYSLLDANAYLRVLSERVLVFTKNTSKPENMETIV